MYYPKSQIETNLYTAGSEFSTIADGREYIGVYWRTSKGKYYTGTNPQDSNIKELSDNIRYNSPDGLAL